MKTMEQKQIYDFIVKDTKGNDFSLEQYRGKVILVVNTASKCGFTPQFKGLEALWEKYRDQGLVIIGFPCNQFASQEPGSDEDIHQFCEVNYGVTFPIMRKIKVNGPHADPLYTWLKQQKGGILGNAIKWNFTKFLINRDGKVIERFAPTTTAEKMEAQIVKTLSD